VGRQDFDNRHDLRHKDRPPRPLLTAYGRIRESCNHKTGTCVPRCQFTRRRLSAFRTIRRRACGPRA
jgi:hypothetical protein